MGQLNQLRLTTTLLSASNCSCSFHAGRQWVLRGNIRSPYSEHLRLSTSVIIHTNQRVTNNVDRHGESVMRFELACFDRMLSQHVTRANYWPFFIAVRSSILRSSSTHSNERPICPICLGLHDLSANCLQTGYSGNKQRSFQLKYLRSSIAQNLITELIE